MSGHLDPDRTSRWALLTTVGLISCLVLFEVVVALRDELGVLWLILVQAPMYGICWLLGRQPRGRARPASVPEPGVKDRAGKVGVLGHRNLYYRNPHRARSSLSGVAVLLLVALIPVGLVALGAMFVKSPSGTLLGVAMVVVVAWLIGLAKLGVARVRSRPAGNRQQPAPVSAPWARSGGEIAPLADWSASRARFAQLRSEYGQFECDPLAVLRLPALIDVSVPSTARFVDVFAEAQALDTDVEPPEPHSARFASAVEQAWRA